MALKLSELLDHEPFDLRLVTGTAPTTQVVLGVTAIEWPEPGRWLAPGYLVMTNGMALRGSIEKQQRFVEEVHRAGAPAVGLWVRATFKTAPPAMVERADAMGLPMFTAPYELPSREIISFVMRSALIEEQSLSRAVTAQDYLLGALGEPMPVASLVERMHTVLRAAVVAFSPVGDVVASAGSPPVGPMWSAICAEQEVVPLDRDWLFTAIALVDDVPFVHLVVRLHDRPRTTTYAGSVVRFAARVLQMIGLAAHARGEQDRASRVALLRDLLETSTPDRTLLERSSVLGFRLHEAVRVVVADIAPGVTREDALTRFGAAFAREHIVTIHDADEEGILALIERGPAERSVLAGLVSGDGAVLQRVGIGLGVPLEEGIHQTHREALIARLRARRERSESVWFDDIGLADQLLSYLPADRLQSAADLLAPLREERPDLLETLGAYLERDCNVLTTAAALHLHANSVRYRLSVIERVLGRSLASLDTLLELTLAMRIEAVAGRTAVTTWSTGAVARSGS
jgi:purine catabolism regulator